MKRLLSITTLMFAVALLSGCGSSSRMSSAPLEITASDAPAGATAVEYNGKGFSLTARGGTPPYKWNWAPAPNSDLPPGLRLDGASVSGTPQSSGEFRVIFSVTDSGYPAAQTSAALTVSIDAALTIATGTPPNGTVGVGYGPLGTIYMKCNRYSNSSFVFCGRCSPSIAGSCPTNTCVYFNGQFGPFPCTKTAYGHVGFTLKASGGAAPYTWTSKGLPPGLGLYTNLGIISGKPTTAGTYYVTVYVKDSEPIPKQFETHYTIKIYP